MPRPPRQASLRVRGAFSRILRFGPLLIPVTFLDPADQSTLHSRIFVRDGVEHPVIPALVTGPGAPEFIAASEDETQLRVFGPNGYEAVTRDDLYAAIGQPDGVTPLLHFIDATELLDGRYSVMGSLSIVPGAVSGNDRLRRSTAAAYGLGVLLAALARDNVAALAQIVVDDTPRFIAIQLDGSAAVLRYVNEGTPLPPNVQADVVTDDDAIMYARMFIAGHRGRAPSLRDTTATRVATYLGSRPEPSPAVGPADAPSTPEEVSAALSTIPEQLGAPDPVMREAFRGRARRTSTLSGTTIRPGRTLRIEDIAGTTATAATEPPW